MDFRSTLTLRRKRSRFFSRSQRLEIGIFTRQGQRHYLQPCSVAPTPRSPQIFVLSVDKLHPYQRSAPVPFVAGRPLTGAYRKVCALIGGRINPTAAQKAAIHAAAPVLQSDIDTLKPTISPLGKRHIQRKRQRKRATSPLHYYYIINIYCCYVIVICFSLARGLLFLSFFSSTSFSPKPVHSFYFLLSGGGGVAQVEKLFFIFQSASKPPPLCFLKKGGDKTPYVVHKHL